MLPRLRYLTTDLLIGNDPPCLKPECDFSDFWRAGLTARLPGGSFPHPSVHPGVQFPLPGGYHEGFPYPPTMLLPAGLISHLPFEPAFFVWTAAWIAAAALALRWAKLSWPVITAALLSPAALWNIELGQMGLIGGALLVAGMLAPGRPLAGGALLGLLSCKPQFGLLVPAVLVGGRNWRAGQGFLLCCATLSLAVLLCFGWPVWHDYLHAGAHGGISLLNAPFAPGVAEGSGVSVFWLLRSLGAGLGLAYAVQATILLLAFAATAWLWRSPGFAPLDRVALTVILTLLATPYGYTDDMVGFSIVLAALAERRGWQIGMLDALFWMWPAICQPVSMATGVLFTPIIVALALGRTLWEAGWKEPA
nr:glycosyltransferase family 87 protein [Acidocella aromatica]